MLRDPEITEIMVNGPSSIFVERAGKIFPVHALADALLAAYNPHTTGGLRWGDLAILAAWGLAGLIIAVRRFSWLPRAG